HIVGSKNLEGLFEQLHHFDPHDIEMTKGGELKIVSQVESRAPHDRNTAKAWIVCALAHHITNPFITPVERYLIDQMSELIVKIQVRGCALWNWCRPITEGPSISHQAIVQGVAQNIASIELIKTERAVAARQPDSPSVEELFQLPDNSEDADLFVLVDVIEIAHRHDPFGSDLVVVGFDSLRYAGLAKLIGRVRPHTCQLRQAFVRRWRRLLVLLLRREEQIVDLLHQRIRQLRITNEIGGVNVGYLLAQPSETVEKLLIIGFVSHNVSSFFSLWDNGSLRMEWFGSHLKMAAFFSCSKDLFFLITTIS